jgi:hypothetical protein
MHDPQCLKTFCTIGEAAAIETILENAGVRCRISEEAGGIWGAQVGSLGSVRVLVAEEDLERAADILRAHEESLRADAEKTDESGQPYWNAPEAFAPFEGDSADAEKRLTPSQFVVWGIVLFVAALLVSCLALYLFRLFGQLARP